MIGTFQRLFPGAPTTWVGRVHQDVDDLFNGRHRAYCPLDLHYHDQRHTLMATVCMVLLLEGYQNTHSHESLSARDFELAVASVLLHDTGYAKLREDTQGTGAKYTFCHIVRSCAFAASYLPDVGATDAEVEGVLAAINCTGPTSEIARLRFRNEGARFVGCALATSDYLGQLSDPLYPTKLGQLFREFEESDTFSNVPLQQRAFRSEQDLVRRTPGFWRNLVKPKLDRDFQGVYRFLARPAPEGPNPYMEAVEANIARIERAGAA